MQAAVGRKEGTERCTDLIGVPDRGRGTEWDRHHNEGAGERAEADTDNISVTDAHGSKIYEYGAVDRAE